jgi:hypothetical protein
MLEEGITLEKLPVIEGFFHTLEKILIGISKLAAFLMMISISLDDFAFH